MSELYVGLELGSRHFEQLVMDAEGTVKSRRRFPISEANLIKAFAALKGAGHVHFEAGELAAWVRRLIKPLVKTVTVSHARENAWIAKDPNKADRIDVFKLADLRRMNRVHPVYYSDDPLRQEFKELVLHQKELTRQEVVLKFKIKSRFRRQGIIVHDQSLFTAQGFRQRLAEVKSPQVRKAIEQLYQALCHTLEVYDQASELMLTASRRFPEVERFQEVPGIGPMGAARFSAYVQDPHRFSNKRKQWRYCRLGVSDRTSDGKKLSYPRLDRAGRGELKDVARKAFNAALRTKEDNQFKRAYERALETTHDATHARLIVMRKIISVLRAMWLTNTHYQDELG